LVFDRFFKFSVHDQQKLQESFRAVLVFASVLTLLTYVQTVSVLIDFEFEQTPFHTITRPLSQVFSLNFLHFTAVECQFELPAAGRIVLESAFLITMLLPLAMAQLVCYVQSSWATSHELQVTLTMSSTFKEGDYIPSFQTNLKDALVASLETSRSSATASNIRLCLKASATPLQIGATIAFTTSGEAARAYAVMCDFGFKKLLSSKMTNTTPHNLTKIQNFFWNSRTAISIACSKWLIALVILFYQPLVSRSMEAFNCPGGKLSVDPKLQCSVDDTHYARIAVVGAVSTVAFSCGPLVVLAYLLYTLQKRPDLGECDGALTRRRSRQLLRQRRIRGRQMFFYSFLRRDIEIYGSLFLPFEGDCYYWQLVIMTRKFVLVFVEKVFSNSPMLQLTLGVLVLVTALALQYRYKPFLVPDQDKLELIEISATLVLVLAIGSSSLSGGEHRHAVGIFCVIVVALSLVWMVKILRDAAEQARNLVCNNVSDAMQQANNPDEPRPSFFLDDPLPANDAQAGVLPGSGAADTETGVLPRPPGPGDAEPISFSGLSDCLPRMAAGSNTQLQAHEESEAAEADSSSQLQAHEETGIEGVAPVA
jgi:hypothetical protein